MKLIVNAKMLLNVFLAIVILSGAALAQGPALMTIRFNQKNIAYQSKLNDVVQQALALKPTTVFEVVNVTPEGQGTRGQEVAEAITKAGAPAAQVTVSSETGNVNSEEVRVFVR